MRIVGKPVCQVITCTLQPAGIDTPGAMLVTNPVSPSSAVSSVALSTACLLLLLAQGLAFS